MTTAALDEDDDALAALRDEVRTWLGAHWRPDRPAAGWLAAVVDAGWAAPAFPLGLGGRSLSSDGARVVHAEFAAVGAPGSRQDQTNLWARTVLAHGSDALRRRFVPALLRDALPMCLLYSEPGAGSDLAAVQTTAVRDGDEWVVDGQKVWTSGGREADYGMLIARTDWDQPKHRGITFFWFPMRQPGVEVRPLRQATGDARFNEVFLTGARVPDANRLGELNAGWTVLQTALAYERAVMGVAGRGGAIGGERGTAAGRAYTPGGSIPVPDLDLVGVARDAGMVDDALTREHLAHLRALRMVNGWTGRRAAVALAGSSSSSLASLGKLSMSHLLHLAGHQHGLLLGAEAMLDAGSSPAAADANYSHLNAFFTSIGGGTDQIQRNIIGERLLGLPREPDVDRELPFRQIRRAAPPA